MAEYDIPKLTAGKLAPGVLPDATTTAKGVIRLSGDLAGTADAPTVPGLEGKADATHSHVIADVADYTPPDLSGLVETTDPRLSDSRTPTAHSHAVADVTGLQGALDGKQAAGSYAASSHGHTLDDATDTAARVAMTPTERAKLEGIAAGAEVNVNADWNASSGDAQILNKPAIPTPPPDASITVKGVVRLAGDLAGTAAAPTVPGLAGKANTSHTHAAGDIASGTLAIARIPTGTTSSTVALGDHTHTAAAVGAAPAAHSHGASDLSGVVKTINGSPPDASGNATVLTSSGGSGISPILSQPGIGLPIGSYYGQGALDTVAGRAMGGFFTVPAPISVGAVRVCVSTPQPGSTCRLGIYSTAPDTVDRIILVDPVVDSLPFNASAQGLVTITMPQPVILPAGRYAAALVSDIASVTVEAPAYVGHAPGWANAPAIVAGRYRPPRAFQVISGVGAAITDGWPPGLIAGPASFSGTGGLLVPCLLEWDWA